MGQVIYLVVRKILAANYMGLYKEDIMLDEIVTIFPPHIRQALTACMEKQREREQWRNMEEIRVRINRPMQFYSGGEEYFLRLQEPELVRGMRAAYIVRESDIQAILTFLSRYSIYAYEEELRQGFLTLEGGHRVGVAGRAVSEHSRVVALQDIQFLNVRIAHQCRGCAERIYPYLYGEGGALNTLIMSPPGMGKTTLLRDCIRLLSDGAGGRSGCRVGVVDERSEIAACHRGIPQNDLGIRTDVLDGCSKAVGMRMLLRSMSPEVIAVDELGGEEDFAAVEQVLYSGSRILGTIHAEGVEQARKKPRLKRWLECGIFDRCIVIRCDARRGRGYAVMDGTGRQLWSDY